MAIQIPKKEHSWGARIFIGGGLAILVIAVAALIYVMHNHYDYHQYLIRLEYVMGGQTSTVQTIDEEGNTCDLSSVNRRALYGFLADSSGQRLQFAPGSLTGRSISFTAESAVGTAVGSVSENNRGYTCIKFTYEGKTWKFYCKNRSIYDYYVRTVSPDGWVEPNPDYHPAGEGSGAEETENG